MLDLLVIVWLMLKWVHIWWKAISRWYNEPRKIYKGTVKHDSYSAKNSRSLFGDDHRAEADRCVNFSSGNKISIHGSNAKSSEVNKKKSADGGDSRSGIENIHGDSPLGRSDLEYLDESRSARLRSSNPNARQNNGYFISERLNDTVSVSRKKSKSKSPSPIYSSGPAGVDGSESEAESPNNDSAKKKSKRDKVICSPSESISDIVSSDSKSLSLRECSSRTAKETKSKTLQNHPGKTVSSQSSNSAITDLDLNLNLWSESKEKEERSKIVCTDNLDGEKEKVDLTGGCLQQVCKEVEWTNRTFDESLENVSKSVSDVKFYKDKVTLVSHSKTLTRKVSPEPCKTVNSETEDAYRLIKQPPECKVVLKEEEVETTADETCNITRTIARPSELKIRTYSQNDAVFGIRSTGDASVNGETFDAKMAYRRSVSADSSPYRTYHAPQVERISVYEKFLEKERKELLARLSERRKSLECISREYTVPHYFEEVQTSSRRSSPSPVIISKSLRRKTAQRTTRSLEMLETRTRYTDSTDYLKSYAKDYSKYSSSSRQNLSEGMIRTKIREHMSNIIGKRLYADDDVMYSYRGENPLYLKDEGDTDRESTVTSDFDASSEQNELKTDEEIEDYLADEENDEALKITKMDVSGSDPVLHASQVYDKSCKDAISWYTEPQSDIIAERNREKGESLLKPNFVQYSGPSAEMKSRTVNEQSLMLVKSAETFQEGATGVTLSLANINFEKLSSGKGPRKLNIGVKSAWNEFSDEFDTVPEEDILTPTFQVIAMFFYKQ